MTGSALATNGISTRHLGAVLHIVLDRPEVLNAVNTSVLRELRSAMAVAERDDSVRVVTLTGAGRAFCSGGDLTGKDTEGSAELADDVVRAITALPKPVVAGVHGPAAGVGCPLALCCDLVIAARSAFFQLSFARVGLMPDGGATALLPAAIGRSRATRMAFLAERITADTAFEWGMISHVVDDDSYQREFDRVVGELADGPTTAYGWTKRALRTATLSQLGEAQAVENDGQRALVRSTYFRRAADRFRGRIDHNGEQS